MHAFGGDNLKKSDLFSTTPDYYTPCRQAQQCVLREKEREVRVELEGVVARYTTQLTEKNSQLTKLSNEMVRARKIQEEELSRQQAEHIGVTQKLRDSQV